MASKAQKLKDGTMVSVYHKGCEIDFISASVNANGENEAVVAWDSDNHPVTDEVRMQLQNGIASPVTITLTDGVSVILTEKFK